MATEGRIMALDVGDVRIGVALTDPLGIIAQPHSVIQSAGVKKDVETICGLIAETGTIRVVAGLPLNQDGKPGPQAEKVLAFVEALREAAPVEIVTQDERFTTAFAQRSLIAAGVRREGRKKVVDKIAAQQILQTHLDRAAAAARSRKDS